MKLELKHIQAYPLETLEFILSEKGIFNLDSEYGTPHQATQPMKITSLLLSERIEVELHSEKSNWGVGYIELYEITPILHPLSDLTNVFLRKNPLKVNKHKYVIEYFIMSGRPIGAMNKIVLREYLYEHRFDVFGLIDAGLAIDINTLNN